MKLTIYRENILSFYHGTIPANNNKLLTLNMVPGH